MAANKRSNTPALDHREKRTKFAVPIAKYVRQVAPGSAGPGKPEHGFHKQPVVSAATARIPNLARQMRSHPLPNSIFQHQSNRHPSLCKRKLESDFSLRRNLEGYVRAHGTVRRIRATSCKPD
jgi:hypothetical protein